MTEFYKEIAESLTEIKVSQAEMNEHLKNLNGTVARHEKELKGAYRIVESCQYSKNRELREIMDKIEWIDNKMYIAIGAFGAITATLSVLTYLKTIGVW